jgi:hypothetical protein
MSTHDTISRELAEGRAHEKLRTKAAAEHGSQNAFPILYRFVVREVIFDPQVIDAVKLDFWENDLGVSNIQHAVVAPQNAIIASRMLSNSTTQAEQVMVLYPIFPPHLAMPVKPGEHVWGMFEDQAGTKNDLGYWLCRIVGPHFTDDVNHSHAHRARNSTFFNGTKDAFDGAKPVYDVSNGDTGVSDGEPYTVAETASVVGKESAYKDMMEQSDGGKISVREAVPRYRKRPGDLVIQGSNNSLIALGRDRSGAVADYENTPSHGNRPKNPRDDETTEAGSIDLVAGRGQTSDTGGVEVNNQANSKEIGKGFGEITKKEGDPDLSTDRSRVLISQKTVVDRNFELENFNAAFSFEKQEDGTGAVVIKTDKIRLIARSDVEVLVTGFSDDNKGRMVTEENSSNWCAIVLKSNGDIILKPSELGFVRLGGEDADRGIVCTSVPAIGVAGQIPPVATPPIMTTMGGRVAVGGPFGQLSTKVFIK